MKFKDKKGPAMNQAVADIVMGAKDAPQATPPGKGKDPAKIKSADYKKFATYYLDSELIRWVRIHAVGNEEQPAHVVERALKALQKSEG